MQAELLRHHTQSPTLPTPRVREQGGFVCSEVVEVVGEGKEQEGEGKEQEKGGHYKAGERSGKTLFQYLPLPVRKLKFWSTNAASRRS